MSEIKVNSIKGVGATNAAITINNTDGTCTGNISNRPNYNLLINGQFDVWQRATTSGSTTSSGYNSADRWYFDASGGTYTASQQAFDVGQTDVPSNPKYYLRFNPTTADDFIGMQQRIEDVDSAQGQHTLSFWAKGTNPAGGSIQIVFLQNFGSGGSSQVNGTISTFTVSGTWTKKTFTFTPTSISGKTIGAGSYFAISIRQPSGDDTSTAWTLDIANVKLEAGSKATDYQRINYGQELALCQRYFYNYMPAGNQNRNIGIGCYTGGGNQYELSIRHPVVMRDTPTYEEVGGTDFFANFGNTGGNGIVTYSGFSADQLMNISTGLFTTNAGTHGGKATRARLNNASASMAFDAEL